ncbi:MAG: hypothetical protein ACK41D_05295 [Rubricoccaceae bacterium]
MLAPLVVLGVFSAAAWLLYNEVRAVDAADVAGALAGLPRWRIGLAVLALLANYAVLGLYDTLGVQYLRRKVPLRRTALAGMLGFAFSTGLGHAVLTGGGVRYRLYTSWGVSVEDVARLIVFVGVAFWVGFLLLGGLVFTLAPPEAAGALGFSPRVLGLGLLALLAGYFGLAASGRGPLRLGRFSLYAPRLPLALTQATVAATDLFLAGLILWLLIPVPVAFPLVLGTYLLALIAGAVSQVPGGLGVFDGVIVLVLGELLPLDVLLGSLLAFRLLYYLIPLVVASAVFAGTEVNRVRRGSRLAALRRTRAQRRQAA